MRSQKPLYPINSKLTGASERQQQQLNLKHRQEHLSQAQETICRFFVANMRKESSDWILQQFDNLFISQSDVVDSEIHHALYAIISLNQEQLFRDTLKRSCYILINNWSAVRYYQPIEKLIQLFSQQPENKNSLSPTKQRFRKWLVNFLESQDYKELNLFFSRYNNRNKYPWSNRYASYLLASQSLDSKNPKEQREAAKVVYHEVKKQFNFDLAMYTARTPLALAEVRGYQNPTVLGDELLPLLQEVLKKRGNFSYTSLANIFLRQIDGLSYQAFKKSFLKYLFFSIKKTELLEVIEVSISDYIESLYQEHNKEVWNPNLLLRTCNRAAEYLTTRNQGKPSKVFSLLVVQGGCLPLSLLLVKIILVSKNSYIHLESQIGYLIQYYESEPEGDCQWLINFLETLKVTLAIYAENTRYNLVSLNGNSQKAPMSDDFSSYRIFSQVKLDHTKTSRQLMSQPSVSRRR
jgi:hypothetical protein